MTASVRSEDFDRSVFINCPFDEDYRPVLEALIFCLIDCGLIPRIASERLDSGEVRLRKIVELVKQCRYSIHDLSRTRASEAGELARLNMPFELGIDFGMSQATTGRLSTKRLLVMADDQYEYQAALSDIAGWDIAAHAGDFEDAIREARRWLASIGLTEKSPSQLVGDYLGYQEWDYERLLFDGWAEDDIQARPTSELIRTMLEWIEADRPSTY